jgi:hypothetical protein
MDYKVIHLWRRPSGGTNRREASGDAPELRVGRGAECEVRLEDSRIRLHQATVREEGAGWRIDAAGETELHLEGRATHTARIDVGSRFSIGPYDLTVIEPPPGIRVAIEVELVRAAGNDLAELRARSGLSLEATRLSMRGLALFAMAATAVCFVVIPGLDAVTQFGRGGSFPRPVQALSAGELSDAHKVLSRRCEVCHVAAFRKVGDAACLACHPGVSRHAGERFAAVAPATTRCVSCHPEHHGARSPTIATQRLCAGCHARPSDIQPESKLLPAADFATLHPAFTPDSSARGLKFSHRGHLRPEGVVRGNTRKKLVCADCHRPDRIGVSMRAVSMERDCRTCHALHFDRDHVGQTLPHGDVARVLATLGDYYAALALREGVSPPSVEKPSRLVPGRPATAVVPPDPAAAAQAAALAERGARFAFSLALCGECHTTVSPDSSGSGTFEVEPVRRPPSLLSGARFTHEPHRTTPCLDCHAVDHAETLGDRLLPSIAICRSCHGGENATRRVPSTCIDCHGFHRTGFPRWASGAEATAAMTPVG